MEDASGTNGFNNGVNTTNEYSFDGNGNLTADLNKGYTSILYNYLNLPIRVGTATAGQYISYIYDAAGTKLAKVSTTGAYTYYAGNFVYSGSSLNYIIYQEGHVEPGGAYKYYLKDHLGSVRMVVNTTGTGGTIEQQTDYYPFGMTIAEYNGSIIDYRYNGKELQDDLINSKKLDWYDYGARMYDPQIGRFHTVDPLTEKFYFLTPYQYGSNNPVTNIDIDGLEGVPFNAPWLIAKWAEFKARAQEVGGAASRLLTGTSGSNMPENKIPGTNLSNKTLATWNDVGIVGQGVADLAEGTANVIGNIPGFETAVEIGGIVINAAEGDLEGANPYLIGLSSPLLSGTQLKLGKAGLEEIVDLAAGSGTPRVKSTKQLRKEWEEINGEAWPKDSETGRNMVAAHKDALADGGADAGSNITPMTNSAHIQDHKEKGDFIRWGKRRRNE